MRLAFLLLAALMAVLPAAAQPAGVKAVEGVWTTEDGKPLFLYASDVSLQCVVDCPDGSGWRALAAAPGETSSGHWQVFANGRGERMWGFRGSLLYTYAGSGEADAVRGWRKARALQEGATSVRMLNGNDPAITVAPQRVSGPEPVYPPAALRAAMEGVATARFCVDETGAVQYPEIVRTTDYTRLDDATRYWAWMSRFSPAKAGGEVVILCNLTINLVWKIQADSPPPTQ